MFPNAEQAANAELFYRMPLVTVVVVVGGRRSKGARRGIGPGSRIQNEISVGVDAVAVQILEEKGLPGNAVHERA